MTLSSSLQKLSDADKLYTSSAAAYMELSDPRLCHPSALRLGTPTPDNKNGKREDKSEGGDKLIPVKEEEGVERGIQQGSEPGDYGVPPGWCDQVTVLHGDLHDPVPGLFMPPPTQSPSDPGQEQARAQSPGAPGSEVTAEAAVCSVFSLSECEVTPGPVCSVSSVSVPCVPVTEVRPLQHAASTDTSSQHSKCLNVALSRLHTSLWVTVDRELEMDRCSCVSVL